MSDIEHVCLHVGYSKGCFLHFLPTGEFAILNAVNNNLINIEETQMLIRAKGPEKIKTASLLLMHFQKVYLRIFKSLCKLKNSQCFISPLL